MSTPRYSAHALRYAQSVQTRSRSFFRYDLQKEPDAEQKIDWYFWLLQNGDKTVLVDCGYDRDRGAAKGRRQGTDPLELLSRAGVSASDVDHLVVSHAHYDHIGNMGLFPNAEVTIARAEFDWAAGPYADRFPTNCVVLPEETRALQEAAREQRVSFVDDGRHEVVPGVSVWTVGGHTPGQLLTEVTSDAGRLVLASDAAHLYEEIETGMPFNMFTDLDGMLRAYDELHALSEQPGIVVVAGHDPRVGAGFAEVEPECFDLTRPTTTERVWKESTR